MQLGFGRGVSRVAEFPFSCLAAMLAAVGAMAVAGCTPDGGSGLAAAQPRGATVAFESIDGPPPEQFRALVQNLNDEAQSRRLPVISREAPAAYHVRGYLAAKVVKGETTISWVWDVFDRDEHRALRISGDETTKDGKGRSRDVWNVADDAMLRRIAHSSVEQLASFLTSAEVAPATSGEPRLAFLGTQDSSPEAAGIFRIVPSNADPVEAVQAPDASSENADPLPLPRRKPASKATVSARETMTLSAAGH